MSLSFNLSYYAATQGEHKFLIEKHAQHSMKTEGTYFHRGKAGRDGRPDLEIQACPHPTDLPLAQVWRWLCRDCHYWTTSSSCETKLLLWNMGSEGLVNILYLSPTECELAVTQHDTTCSQWRVYAISCNGQIQARPYDFNFDSRVSIYPACSYRKAVYMLTSKSLQIMSLWSYLADAGEAPLALEQARLAAGVAFISAWSKAGLAEAAGVRLGVDFLECWDPGGLRLGFPDCWAAWELAILCRVPKACQANLAGHNAIPSPEGIASLDPIRYSSNPCYVRLLSFSQLLTLVTFPW